MRALITGVGGFVGGHLARHLAENGDEVVGFDRDCDVTDVAAVTDRVADAAPDAVYHLAARTHVGESWLDPEGTERVNVQGTAALLRAARSAAPAARILIVSSADVYGVVDESELPLTETHPPAPVSPYARSKWEAERVALAAMHTYGQLVIVVRPFNHVGPGQATTFFVPALVERLVRAAAAGEDEVAVGNLTARRDFTDVRDVVVAYRRLVTDGHVGEVYHVASGHDVALSDLATRLVAELAPGARLVADPQLMRPVDVPVLCGSFAKLRGATGWTPSIDLDASLRDVIANVRARVADAPSPTESAN